MFFYISLQSTLKPSLNDTCPTLFCLKLTKWKRNTDWLVTGVINHFQIVWLQHCSSTGPSRIYFFSYVLLVNIYSIFSWYFSIWKCRLNFFGKRKIVRKSGWNAISDCFEVSLCLSELPHYSMWIFCQAPQVSVFCH